MAIKPYRDRERERESARGFREERDRERERDRDRERDDGAHRHFPYGRPSVSAWVAAAAVAFAVFLLGGFIKTYRQLEDLEDESRREIATLRESVRRLQSMQAQQASAPAPERRRAPSLAESAAAARQAASPGAPPRYDAADPRAQLRSELPGNATESTIAALPSFDDPEDRGIRYQWGRTSGAPASRNLLTAAGGESQVVSVSAANKRVMIEGGRDIGLEEGGRLELCRDGRWIADLRVQDVFGNQSLCEVLHATHPPQPGDTVRTPEKSL